MPRKRRFILVILCTLIVLVTSLASWIQWGGWPDPKTEPLPWIPDTIVILGGGDDDRARQGKRLADQFPEVPVFVTGDGGKIVRGLVSNGLSRERIIHEENATSTLENAQYTKPALDHLRGRRVVLVTNWFHVPRALAVFRKVHPGKEFAASFEQKPTPLTPWDRGAQRRERLAAVMYLLQYGVWSW